MAADSACDEVRGTEPGRLLTQKCVTPSHWYVGASPVVGWGVAMEPRAFRAVTSLRPGMVDWASLIFRDEERILADHAGEPEFYARVLLPRKLALARLYQRHAGPGLDLRLRVATLATVLGADGIARTIVGAGLWDRARRL